MIGHSICAIGGFCVTSLSDFVAGTADSSDLSLIARAQPWLAEGMVYLCPVEAVFTFTRPARAHQKVLSDISLK